MCWSYSYAANIYCHILYIIISIFILLQEIRSKIQTGIKEIKDHLEIQNEIKDRLKEIVEVLKWVMKNKNNISQEYSSNSSNYIESLIIKQIYKIGYIN